jgi:hypothetical protein
VNSHSMGLTSVLVLLLLIMIVVFFSSLNLVQN